MKISFQLDADFNEETEQEVLVISDIEDESSEESYQETEILSNEQIKKFKNIYLKKKIEDDEITESDQHNMDMDIDIDIDKYMEIFKKKNCCGKECFKNLNYEEVKIRYKCFIELKKIEQDIFLKGILAPSMKSELNYTGAKRQKMEIEYQFNGVNICSKAFMGIYGIGKTRWNNIRNHFSNDDIKKRQNALMGRVGNRTTPFDTVLKILIFIIKFSNINGLPSPGKYKCELFFNKKLLILLIIIIIGRNFRKDTKPLIFLPANETYSSIYNYYSNSIDEVPDILSVSYSTFCRIWKTYLPDIKFLTPRSDLCGFCKEHRFNAKYWTQEEKDKKIIEWSNHITWAFNEREYYRYIFIFIEFICSFIYFYFIFLFLEIV